MQQIKHEKYYQLGLKKLAETESDVKSLIEMAIQAGEAGKREDALMWWQRVIEIDPNESTAYYNIGSIYLYLKRYAEAIEVCKKSLALNPHRKEAVTNLAFGEIIGGNLSNAMRSLEELINKKVEYPVAIGLLAISYCIGGRVEAGLKLCARLRKKNFRLTSFMQDTSQKLVEAGRSADAMKLLKALIEGGFADYELASYYAECEKKDLPDMVTSTR